MFKDILVTIDLNEKESWQHALPQAVELVRASKGTLHVMSVVPDFGMPLVAGFFPEGFKEKALTEAEGKLEALIDDLVPDDVDAQAHLAYGRIHEEILKAIEKTEAGLVVMASHAPDTLREFLVGSEADRVVRRSPVSVLVVRA